MKFPVVPRSVVRRHVHGFTLLELIIVMVIVALSLSIVGPGVSRWMIEPQQLDPLEQLQTDLIHMRNRAGVEDGAVTVYVDFKFQELSAYSFVGNELLRFFLPEGYRFAPDEMQINDSTGEVLVTNEQRIIFVFQPNGTATDAGFMVILPDGGKRRVVIRGGSGRILVINPETGEAAV